MTHQFINTELKKITGTHLDVSQYIGFLYKKEAEKIKKGIEIGTLTLEGGRQMTISIVGLPTSTNHKGEQLTEAIEYAKYLKEGRHTELNNENVSYIQLDGFIGKREYKGIFYSLSEMLTHLEKIEENIALAEPELVTE